MSTRHELSDLEFSVPISVDSLPAVGLFKTLEASPEQRRRLAARFDLIDLSLLKAELEITSARAGEAVAVTGIITADVVQRCVVTLEPLPAHIHEEIEVLFVKGADAPPAPQSQMDPLDDEVEALQDGVIDIGELVAQNLGISLDPYPRKPGVQLPAGHLGDADPVVHPFAKLSELKVKPKK